MKNYKETRVKLTNSQLNKLKPVAKNNIATTLIINKKIFQEEGLSHELFSIKRNKAK